MKSNLASDANRSFGACPGAPGESVRWMVDLAKRAGAQRIILNGSFVTDIIEPNDVDCVLLVGPDFPKDRAAESELLKGLPFLDVAFG